MADKTISIKLLVDREKEFKNSLQQIGSEMKLLSAEAKKLQAQYAEEANTYDALAAKSKKLGAQYDELTKKLETQKKALENQRELKRQYEAQTESLAKKAEEAAEAYKNAAEKTDKLKDAMREAQNAVNQNAQNIEKAESRAKTYTRQITETETAQILLGRELDKTNMYLQEAATSADGTARSIDKYGNEVKDAAEDTKSFANAADLLAQAIVASGAIEGAEKLRDAIIATAKASIEYESAFAGVKKTVDGTAEELEALSGGLRNMSLEIPIAATELAGIAESAGQLGIETENILKFTDVTAKLAATTDLSANDAAVSISKLGNITKLTADEYSNFGSALVELGNNTSAFESEILAMAMRLASAGDIVGATNSQLLGIAATLVSVGIEAEAGGTAFSKLLRQIEVAVQTGSKKVQEYATVAGMSVEEFSSAWKNDAVGAVTAFIEGLGSLESKGQSSIVVLNEMGLTEQRLLDTISRLSEAEGMLSNNIAHSNTAWEENTALAEEAAVRFETTESKLQLLSNAFENLEITVGDQLTAALGEPLEALTGFVGGLDEFVQKYPGVTSAIAGLAAGFGTLAVVGTVLPLISSLGAALAALPHGVAIAGITALAAAIGGFVLTLPKAVDEFEDLKKSIENLEKRIDTVRQSVLKLKEANEEEVIALKSENEEIQKAIKTVEELGNKSDITASESEILKTAMDNLNRSIPGLKLGYDNLNDSLEDTVYHLRLVAAAQALVDEAVSKTNLKVSLESQTQGLEKEVENAKKAYDDAKTLLDEKKALEKEFFESRSGSKQTEEALKPGETAWSPYAEEIKTLTEALEDADTAWVEAVRAREANKRSVIELTTEISNLDTEYAKKADEIKEINKDLFDNTKKGTVETSDAFDDFLNKISESGDKAASSLSGFSDAFKAGFSVPLLTAINDTADNSGEVIGKMMERYNELVSTYGEGSVEVRAFVDDINTAFSESAGAEDALVMGLKELGIVIEDTSKKTQKTTKETKEATDEAGQAIIDHAKTVQSNLEALSKEYDSVYQSAKSSLGGIGGLFGEVAFNTDKSISDMISGMQTQADYFTGYMLNLQRAAQIGIDEGLVAALADGSDQSAGYLQKIINEFNQLSDKYGENSTEAQDFITDFNEAFEASSAAKDALARTMAGIATDFETRKGEILGQAQELISELEGYSGNAYDEVAAAVTATVGNVSDTLSRMETAISESSVRAGAAMQTLRETLDAKLEGTEEKGEEAGANYTAGLAKGIQEGMPIVTMAVQKLVDESIIGAVNQGLEIRSPSRVGMEQGEFYDEGIAVGIERNSGTVTNAALSMIDKLEAQSQSAAAAAGRSLGNIMAQSMADALAAGRALSQAVASGTLTVDGKVVQSAASVGIPSLTGQAALDWNAEQKRDFGLPDDWSNQDIVDWLNAGGFHGGTSSSTQAAIDSALKNESSGKVSLTQTTNKAWHDSYLNQLNANKASKASSKNTPTVVVYQENHAQMTPYEFTTMSEKGVTRALSKI